MSETAPHPPVDEFRAAMRQLAAAVCVVTAGEDGERRGLTATAVCSLSVSPPSMLVCVNRLGEAHPVIRATRAFCVSILAAGQHEVALRFAGQAGDSGPARFAPYRWSRLATGAPALDGALANLDCALTSATDSGSHSIFIGMVRSIRLGPQEAPLLHYNRGFYSLDGRAGVQRLEG